MVIFIIMYEGYYLSVNCVIVQMSVDCVVQQFYIGCVNFIGNYRKEIIC